MRDLVARGRAVADIAQAVGVSAPTLRAHYRADLTGEGLQKRIGLPEFSEPAGPRPAPPGAGRPPHVPTAETRERVEILLAAGMPRWQVAQALAISQSTLDDHYAEQLDAGRARKRADVIVAMFNAAKDGNVAAQKAYLAQDQDLDAPPAPAEPRSAPIGKKEAADQAARMAGQGVDWARHLPH